MSEVVYDRIGQDYTRGRRLDPRWQAALDEVLSSAATVVNIGAGTGSYEPAHRYVLAVEPSSTMIRQPPAGAAPAMQAAAEDLPVADQQFDVAMAPRSPGSDRWWFSLAILILARVLGLLAVVAHYRPSQGRADSDR